MIVLCWKELSVIMIKVCVQLHTHVHVPASTHSNNVSEWKECSYSIVYTTRQLLYKPKGRSYLHQHTLATRVHVLHSHYNKQLHSQAFPSFSNVPYSREIFTKRKFFGQFHHLLLLAKLLSVNC